LEAVSWLANRDMLIAKFAIVLLWIGAVIDPIGNMFGIRYIALAAALVGLIWMLVTGVITGLDKSYRAFIIILLAFVFPLHGMVLYSFRASDQEFIDTSYIASGILITTCLLYRSRSMCELGIRSLILSTRLLSLIVIAAYASQLTSIDGWLGFFTERNVALVSFREYAGFSLPYIYFLASPLLILLMAHDFGAFREKPSVLGIFLFAATAFSFALTGTRAHILIAALFVPLYMLMTSTPKTLFKSFALLIGAIILAVTQEEVLSLISSFTSTSETSNSMKISLLDGYGEIFSSPRDFLLGQGFNAHEWSTPLRGMIAMEEKASKTELTYLELIRVFGLGLAGLFVVSLVLLLRAIKELPENLRWIFPGFAIYLVNAAINPYLFSVNGILPLGLFASMAYYYRKTPSKATTARQAA
jgi:hypothetical protein